MGLEVTRGPAPTSRPSDDHQAATKLPNTHRIVESNVLAALCEAFVVVVEVPGEKYVRRVFLSLHRAIQAVERAQARGRSAWMLLCKLVPVPADLEFGEWMS